MAMHTKIRKTVVQGDNFRFWLVCFAIAGLLQDIVTIATLGYYCVDCRAYWICVADEEEDTKREMLGKLWRMLKGVNY